MSGKYLYLLTILFLLLAGLPYFCSGEDLGIICAKISESDNGCEGMTKESCRSLLEKCSEYYDNQSALIAKDITKTIQQKNTLQNQISLFKKKIQELETQIKEGNIKIKSLSLQIQETESSINKTTSKLERQKNQIKNILRVLFEENRKSGLEILLEGNLLDFFTNLTYLQKLNSKLNDLVDETKRLNAYLQQQKIKMDEEVNQLQKTVALQSLKKKENEQNQKEYQEYLKLTETQYQQKLKEKEEISQRAAKIKAMLFQLVGVSVAPTFGEALEIAKTAASIAGIRPAFLLAIISQESAIGRNVGQCYLTDPNTGEGKKVTSGALAIRVMNPTRDVPIFLELMKKLGRDPYNTPVSCWIPAYVKGVPYGWGGAMGPAQFIPSTWCGADKSNPTVCKFSNRLKNILDKEPDPWAIKDSFVAAALYLADLGASAQTLEKEKIAAGKYFGDSSYDYIQSVIKRADCIQNFIDTGTMSLTCQNLILPNG